MLYQALATNPTCHCLWHKPYWPLLVPHNSKLMNCPLSHQMPLGFTSSSCFPYFHDEIRPRCLQGCSTILYKGTPPCSCAAPFCMTNHSCFCEYISINICKIVAINPYHCFAKQYLISGGSLPQVIWELQRRD